MLRVITASVLIAILVVVAFGAPATLSDYMVRLMIVTCINVVLVSSMGLANGFTGVFSLGQVGFVGVGAYASGILTLSLQDKASYLPDLPAFLAHLELGFFPATIIGGLLCAALAFVVGWPLMRLSGHHVSVATMGFMIIVYIVIINANSLTRGARTFVAVPVTTTLPWALGWAAVTIFVLGRLIYSPIGLALRSVREDTIAGQAIGMSVLWTRLTAFIVGAFFAGVGGSLYAHYLGSFSAHSFYFPLMINLIAMLVLGGMGSLTGAVVGVLAVTILSELLRDLERGVNLGFVTLPPLFGASQVVLGLLFILVMIFRPNGLLGDRELTLAGLARFRARSAPRKDST
jgi:branched-chain amino acid transport system permease protein